MPYIKYRGGQPPASIKEYVSYEDFDAPCREGLTKVVAEARRFAEDTLADGAERASAIREYVDKHPYPGLQHVGGVGFVEHVKLRAVDEVVTPEEYQRLRSEIEQTNREVTTAKAKQLSDNNDPLRRASAVHETFGWRTRVWVLSYTELDHHVAYPLGEHSAAYLRVRENLPRGFTKQLVDIYHRADGDIRLAILEGTDWAEVLVDLLALSGYGAAHILNLVGTTVPFCRKGEEFPLATFGASVFNSPVPVHPDQFETRDLDPIGRLALRHLRDGLSAAVPTAAFAAFWNALEQQAEEEAKLKNFKRIVKCEKCGKERSAGWDHKRSFEAMYAQAGLDPSLFKQHRSKRGTIQHGEKLRTTDYVAEVLQDLSQVQVAAMVAVAKKAGVIPATSSYLSANWPVAAFSCCAEGDGRVSIRLQSSRVQAAAGVLPQRYCGHAIRLLDMSVSIHSKIDALAFPPIQV